MKKIIFYRESNIFDDILKDATVKKYAKTRLQFKEYLILGIDDQYDMYTSYLMIRFGDDVVDLHHLIPDRTPVMNKDYVPKKKDRTIH
jgi:hypothetical protein